MKWPLLCSLAVVAVAAQDPHAILKEADRLFWLDNWLKARPLFAEAENLFDAAGDGRNALYARIGRLRADGDESGYPRISQLLAEQLATSTVQNDPQLKLRCLVVKASIDLSIDPASSLGTWKEAQALAEQLKDAGWANRAKAELGIIAFLQGDTQQAQGLIAQSIMTSMLLKDVAGQIRQLSLVAVGLGELGLNDRALRYADEALKVAEQAPETRFPLMANMAKAKCLEALGRVPEAEALLAKVLEYVDAAGMAVYRSDVLLAIGMRDEEKGRLDQAIEHLRQAASAAEAVGMPRPAASALFRLARIYERQGKMTEAEAAADRATEASRRLVDMYVLPRQLSTAASIKKRVGKIKEAADLYDEAADLVDAMLVNVPTASLRSTLIAVMSEIYEGYTELALNRLKDPELAFQIVERARGRAASEALRATHDGVAGNSVITHAGRAIVEIQIQLQGTRSAQQRRELLARLAEAEENLGSDVRPDARHGFTHAEPVGLVELRASLRQDEAILEFVLGNEASHVMVITKEGFRVGALPKRAAVKASAERLLSEIRSKRQPAPSILRDFSAALLPSEIRAKLRLIVVPDGELHLLPFDVLLGPSGRDLGETHVVSYAPSSTSLHLLRSRQSDRSDRLPVLAVGGVGLKLGDFTDRGTRGTVRTSRGMFDPSGGRLPVLPETEKEIVAIKATLGARSVILTREAATEAAFKRQPLARFRILHLAVHGLADTKFPERSALVLAPAPSEHEDGLLQVREIAGLRLNADLVVLSACDTSVGRLEGQEGMANLVRAFLAAGARNVVSALWEVDDAYGAATMRRFYFHLANGLDPAEALARAKRDLRKRYGTAIGPYFWAPFLAVGASNSGVVDSAPKSRDKQ